MTPDEIKDKVRATFAAMDAAQNMTPLYEVATPDYVSHFAGMPPMDRDGMSAFGDSFYAAFPGLHHEIHEVITEGDTIALRMTLHGVHTAPMMSPGGEIPPTGKTIALDLQNQMHIRDDKVTEHWIELNMMNMMQQLGVM